MFNYGGIITSQAVGVWNAFKDLDRYAQDRPFDIILELGCDYGGLTNLIADLDISRKAKIHAFDINPDRFVNLSPDKITFHHLNIYENFDFIKGLMAGTDRALVLCDGGNKAHEFKHMCPGLRSGDIIMAHDYSPNAEAFEDNKNIGRWNWWEFSDDNIPDSDLFKPLDCFEEYVWCIREKR